MATPVVPHIYRLMRDTAAGWALPDAVTLMDGEPGLERPASAGQPWKLKFGDGVTPWATLPYFGGTGSAASVTFTPTGNIAATNVQAAIAELDTEKVALRQLGTLGVRLENTAGGLPGGSAGQGMELFGNSSGEAVVSSYNRTTLAPGPLTFTFGMLKMPAAGLPNFANDAAAAAGGVALNQVYRNGSVLMVRAV